MNQLKKALLVEDHEIARKVSTLVLTNSNCHVTQVATASQALEKMSTDLFDIVFIDIGLPDMDGLILLEKLRTINPIIPIVVLTANEDREYKRRGLNAGMNEYVVKPLTMERSKQLLASLGLV